MDHRQQHQHQGGQVDDYQYPNRFNDPSLQQSSNPNHLQQYHNVQQQYQHSQRQNLQHPVIDNQRIQTHQNSYQHQHHVQQQQQQQQHHQQQPFSQSPYTRKPSLRSNTSSSTTYSSISSMTSASSSVASPATFSPSWTSQSNESPSSNNGKEQERVFVHASPYLPEQRQHILNNKQQQAQTPPVIEPSVSQQVRQNRTPQVDSRHDTCINLNAASQDNSGTSNSSSDTISVVKPLLRAQDESSPVASPENSSIQARSQPDRSSSSSSSSSSLSSESLVDPEPYETPLTASSGQNERSVKQVHSLNEPGYPFPAVPEVQQRKKKTRESKHQKEDPWKHTDDLLAPSCKSASKLSTGSGAASTLSLSKPSQQVNSVTQHASAPQTTTPTASHMDRRDSQSSATSTRSSNQAKTSSSNIGSTGAISLSQQSSSTNVAKLSTSSSPATSGGMASFSPLSPLVQPFSPSANASALPSKVGPASKGALPQGLANRSTRDPAAQPSQAVSGTQSATRGMSQETQERQQQQPHDTGRLEASSTSSSGDTGYFSGYAPAPQQDQAYHSSTLANAMHGIDQTSSRHSDPSLEQSRAADYGRQHSWSEDEALAMPAGPVYASVGHVSTGLPPSANHTYWAHPRQPIHEDVDMSFSTGAPPPASSHPYGDPRYGRHTGSYGLPVPAAPASYQTRGMSSAAGGLPVASSMEGFDASLYGYGPPSVSDVSTAGNEEICTIFVVGFPEDIQEREFQNMFLFARGFEAATLKIPASTAAARERDTAAAAAVSAIAATLPAFSVPPPPPALDPKHGYGSGLSSAGGSNYDHLNNSLYEETFHAAALGNLGGPGPHGHMESAQRVSSALAAAALTATASTASLANTTNKKQIIGFAKFRSKDDAMVARDLLSGRKIDPEKGCVLKAEMAKKNLHVKKNGTEIQGSSLPSLSMESALPSQREVSALDRLAERERQREWHARMAASADAQQYELRSDHSEVNEREQTRERRHDPTSGSSNWPDAAYDAFHSVPSEEIPTTFAFADGRLSAASANYAGNAHERSLRGPGNPSSVVQAASIASAAQQRGSTGTSNFGKSLLQELDDEEESSFPLPDPAPGFGASAYLSATGEQSSRRQPPPAALPSISSAVPTVSQGGNAYLDEEYRRLAVIAYQDDNEGSVSHSAQEPAQGYQSHHETVYNTFHGPNATTPTSATAHLGNIGKRFTSPDIVSPTFTEFRQPKTQNRADDNMPISTLYVGGLPSSLPGVAGSVSSSQLEDALRNVFARCPGFRRMSYRHKSQGPMCFIEFEDTQHATRALNEIYGHTLGGLVKSGIRLAYSKNPLGVRGSGSNGPDSPTPLSPGYFASDVYSQTGYYGSPASVTAHGQVPTPTMSSRFDSAQGFPHHPTDYSSPPASQQAFAINQQQGYPQHAGHFNHLQEQRHERRATSPSSGPGSTFSPFALRP